MSVQAALPPPAQRAQSALAWRWIAALAPGLFIYFIPILGLAPVQRHILAFFVATILALVTQPVAMGISVLIAMTGLVLTGTLSAPAALSGFSDPTVWLIFTAFLFSHAVTRTNLGLRVAYFFISRFGFNALTLGYSIACSDLALAPFVPSDTARGGGIVCPITRSVAEVLGSEPGTPSRRMGGFLVLVAFHTTYVASAMFLTGMASNPLMADFADKLGHLELTWIRWFLAAAVPGFVSLLVVPFLIYRLYPPKLTNTDAARHHARAELHRMGSLTGAEARLALIMMAVMAGWVTSPVASHSECVCGARRCMRHRSHARAELERFARRIQSVGRSHLVCTANYDGGRIEQTRRDAETVAIVFWLHQSAALGAGAAVLTYYLPIHPLRLREHDGPNYGALSGISCRGAGDRSSTADLRARLGLFFQLECGHHALRHRLGACVLRPGLCKSGGLVEDRICDLSGQPGDLVWNRPHLVEDYWILVAHQNENCRNPRRSGPDQVGHRQRLYQLFGDDGLGYAALPFNDMGRHL